MKYTVNTKIFTQENMFQENLVLKKILFLNIIQREITHQIDIESISIR